MLSGRKRISRLVIGAAASAGIISFLAGRQARADIITTLVGSPVSTGGGQYLYTYDVELAFDSELAPNMGMSEFFTLYDVSKQLPAVQSISGLLSTNFILSEDLSDSPAYKVSPTDNSSVYNIRFSFNGSSTLVGAPYNVNIGGNLVTVGTNLLDLGQFTISSPTNSTTQSYYDGQSFSSNGGNPQGNLGFATVPALVPEPAFLGVIGIGAMGLLGRRRKPQGGLKFPALPGGGDV